MTCSGLGRVTSIITSVYTIITIITIVTVLILFKLQLISEVECVAQILGKHALAQHRFPGTRHDEVVRKFTRLQKRHP